MSDPQQPDPRRIDTPDDFPTQITEEFRQDFLALMEKHGFGNEFVSANIEGGGVNIEVFTKVDGRYLYAPEGYGQTGITHNVFVPYAKR